MSLRLTKKEVELLKEGLIFIVISHMASYGSGEKKIIFNAMEHGKEFEKVVLEPMKAILCWTDEDDKRVKEKFQRLLKEAEEGKTPGEQFQHVKAALDKEFTITGGTLIKGVLVAGITYVATKALANLFKGKKKTGE